MGLRHPVIETRVSTAMYINMSFHTYEWVTNQMTHIKCTWNKATVTCVRSPFLSHEQIGMSHGPRNFTNKYERITNHIYDQRPRRHGHSRFVSHEKICMTHEPQNKWRAHMIMFPFVTSFCHEQMASAYIPMSKSLCPCLNVCVYVYREADICTHTYMSRSKYMCRCPSLNVRVCVDIHV